MATLVLAAVGTAVGGPIGGAIGAVLGQQVDENFLFRPQPRSGPRLQELAVQTSSYGSPIPRIHGTMRVAGTVVWATDLKETRNQEGGGKGRPATTVYSYSACFAVALSSRPIRGIGRIWADGKLFRGAAGDFKTDTRFSLFTGHEDQPVDGLMASAEGAGATPAYRGYALAVFGDMDLTEYGNRIPSLTFETIADDGAVSIADILYDLSGQRIVLLPDETVTGFAGGGEDRRSALSSLTEALPLSFSADPGDFRRIDAVPRSVADAGSAGALEAEFVRAVGGRDIPLPETRTAPAALVPRQLSIRYHEPARDYQSGMQSAWRPGTGRRSVVRDFPAAVGAAQARRLAASGLWTDYHERAALRVAVPLNGGLSRPGRLVAIAGFQGLWRVRECEIGDGYAHLALTAAGTQPSPTPGDTEQGRNVPDADLRAGATRLVLADLPFAVNSPGVASEQARLYAAAAGDSGWRNAQLFAAGSDGTPGPLIGRIPAPAVLGVTLGPLGPANPALVDRINSLEVVLHNGTMSLNPADDSQLLAGRNIAMIGREIIQFAEAVPLGSDRYRLSRLIRGLGGTEAAIADHAASADFVLLDGGAMVEINPSAYTPFAPVTVFAVGRDDPEPVPASFASPGRALVPWSPVHPAWIIRPNGDLDIGWTRRSRAGTLWPDHVEVPLAEEAEKYRVELTAIGGPGPALTLASEVAHIIVPAAQMELFNSSEISGLQVSVRQVGEHMLSDPLAFVISL